MADQLKLHHVGFVTNDVTLFEAFWCRILGFEEVDSKVCANEKYISLFGIRGKAWFRRYRKDNILVEVHSFDSVGPRDPGFSRHGINHICLAVGSKKDFLANLPPEVERVTFSDPAGWTNLFVRDFEGNWIEVREEG